MKMHTPIHFNLAFFPALFLAAMVALPARAATGIGQADLPPFTFLGRITDYNHGSLAGASGRAEIRARRTSGVLVARSAITNYPGTLFNYVLQIPMSSQPTDSRVLYGEQLVFEIDDGAKTFTTTGGTAVATAINENGVYVSSNGFSAVGAPGAVERVDFMAAVTNENGVSADYLATMALLMDINGIEGAWTMDGDLDGDGVSNYYEYLAGTDPLEADDLFRLTDQQLVRSEGGTNVWALTFICGPNRAYEVVVADTLPTDPDDFQPVPHALSAEANAPTQDWMNTDTTQPYTRTVYVTDTGTIRHYALKME